MRKRFLLAPLAVLLGCTWYFGNTVAVSLQSAKPSRSVGTPSAGSLRHGKRLPTAGANFVAYSRLGALLGRNSVHGEVRQVVLDAYREMAREHPDVRFVYGETGWPSGGRFRPHRTHRNGLSVDFMVPVRDAAGGPAVVPTWPWLRWGYDVEFDARGRFDGLEIDFPAVAAHLTALDAAARARGHRIERVILAPELMARLGRAEGGAAALRIIPFMKGKPWVRHDEHYHVDFRLASSPG
jgi:penicillin-insensitive murein DD-endopeptidase